MTAHVVTDLDTAAALGSGDVDVLGTPRLLAWLEAATVVAAGPLLGPGATSVGTAVRIRHRRPTPVGGTVTVRADLVPDGPERRPTFTVTATDADGTIVADGAIDRAVVERDGFGRA